MAAQAARYESTVIGPKARLSCNRLATAPQLTGFSRIATAVPPNSNSSLANAWLVLLFGSARRTRMSEQYEENVTETLSNEPIAEKGGERDVAG
ncbi:unnamed protein product [Heligmosomoides polygyrus]|uniref:Uncharacterized protein n=1 Tax=Heligmosomoides polygyrus TaxID=6339 RepID=A0A183FHM5_HELPZ|nr:unnamed protein product [Heligmosomoides polygyrus]